MIRCGMAVKRMGMLGASTRKMKALTVKMKTVTLIGKGRRALCFKCVKLIVKYFFLPDILLWGVILKFNTNFSLAFFFWGGVILG